MEKNKGRRSRSGGAGSGPGEGLRACQPPGGLSLGDALQFPKEDFTNALRLFRAPEESAVRTMCGRAATNRHGHFARIQLELLAIVHQDALSEVMKIYPPLC